MGREPSPKSHIRLFGYPTIVSRKLIVTGEHPEGWLIPKLTIGFGPTIMEKEMGSPSQPFKLGLATIVEKMGFPEVMGGAINAGIFPIPDPVRPMPVFELVQLTTVLVGDVVN